MTQAATVRLLVFRLDQQRYALPLAVVERVVRAVAITCLPGAPALVLGAIDVHGELMPVLDIRQRFQLPRRDIGCDDAFVLVRTRHRTVAIVVDEAQGVVERPETDIVPTADVVPDLQQFPGIARLDDGLVLIHDVERFLSAGDERVLGEALDASQAR